MSRLYCAPLGESARDIFCEELKNLPRYFSSAKQ